MKRAAYLFASGLLASALPWAYGQAGNPADLQQKLNSMFKVTTPTADLSDIVTAGDVVELHKNGLIMYSVASPLPPPNTYNSKKGKIGQGLSGFGGDVIITILSPGTDTSAVYPQRSFVTGEKCWVLAITVQKDGVLFKLYGDSNTYGISYYANLKIPFPNKKEMPPADEAMKLITEVLSVAPTDNQAAQPAQGGQYATLAGEYLLEQSGQRYIFLPDGSCSIHNPGGTQTQCNFTVDGDWLVINMKLGGMNIHFMNLKIQGDKLYMSGIELVRQGGGPASAPEPAAVAPPAPPATRQYDNLAPPPPPPAPAPTITIGERKAQVLTDFGEPQRKAVNGPKEIFFYTDLKMKLTFIGGKVSSID